MGHNLIKVAVWLLLPLLGLAVTPSYNLATISDSDLRDEMKKVYCDLHRKRRFYKDNDLNTKCNWRVKFFERDEVSQRLIQPNSYKEVLDAADFLLGLF